MAQLQSPSSSTRAILIWGGVILAMILLLVGLAQLGTRGAKGNGQLADPVTDADHSKGNANAKATLVEYSDFQCPACETYYPIVKQLAQDFPNDLRVVYRHYPIRELHEHAQLAAQASEAADKQGKFWDMHDVLFNTQDSWKDEQNPGELFVKYAESIGLNADQFRTDMNSDAAKQAVNDDASSGDRAGVKGTPAFFLNGKQIQVTSYDQFKQLISDTVGGTNS